MIRDDIAAMTTIIAIDLKYGSNDDDLLDDCFSSNLCIGFDLISVLSRKGLKSQVNKIVRQMNPIVGISRLPAPKFVTKGFIPYPAPIPAMEPPAPIILKRRLA